MKIAVLGGGSGAQATAADLSLAGHEIRLAELAPFAENIAAMQALGGIHLTGVAPMEVRPASLAFTWQRWTYGPPCAEPISSWSSCQRMDTKLSCASWQRVQKTGNWWFRRRFRRAGLWQNAGRCGPKR